MFSIWENGIGHTIFFASCGLVWWVGGGEAVVVGGVVFDVAGSAKSGSGSGNGDGDGDILMGK